MVFQNDESLRNTRVDISKRCQGIRTSSKSLPASLPVLVLSLCSFIKPFSSNLDFNFCPWRTDIPSLLYRSAIPLSAFSSTSRKKAISRFSAKSAFLLDILPLSDLPPFYIPVSMRVLHSLSVHWSRRSVAESGPMQPAAHGPFVQN